MKQTLLASIIAGCVMAFGISAANAETPTKTEAVTLTATEMDNVTAGWRRFRIHTAEAYATADAFGRNTDSFTDTFAVTGRGFSSSGSYSSACSGCPRW